MYLLTAFFLLMKMAALAQLPITLSHSADTAKPLIFYITGDGGLNKFSTSFIQAFVQRGYSVVTLNAKDYFWDKKTPQKLTDDVSATLRKYLKEWKHKNFVLLGYSFGADVAPFVYNLLPPDLAGKAETLVLLSPSKTTDFEIHLTDMFGFNHSDGVSVVDQVNKVSKKVVLFFGSDETDFPTGKLTQKNRQVVILKGGHHYDGDVSGLVSGILSRL